MKSHDAHRLSTLRLPKRSMSEKSMNIATLSGTANKTIAAMPISMKIAAGLLVVGVASIFVVIFLAIGVVEQDFKKEFQSSRTEIAKQIANNISGALRFKKADIVEKAYQTLVKDPAKPIAALATVSTKGEVVTQYSEGGQDTARLVSLPKQSEGDASFEGRTVWLGDELISVAPSGQSRDGSPYGYIVIAWNTDIVTNSVSHVRSNLLQILSVAMLVMVGVMLFLVSRLATKPLKHIADRMMTLAEGDVSQPVPYDQRSDEIGSMARVLMTFRDREVKRLVLEDEQRVSHEASAKRQERIESLIDRFRGQVHEMLRGVLKTLSEMQVKTEQLMRASLDTNSQASYAVSNCQDAESKVQMVSASAQQLAQSIREIGENVLRTNSVVADADREAGASAERVNKLSSAAEKIGTVVNLIRNIAEQTNLLALNATIEAARAGDAGKGFAVVASEVKTLANQTAKATEDIAAQIDELQHSTQDTAEAIESINKIVSEVSGISTSISAAIEEQTAATTEISQNIDQAAYQTSSVVSGVTDVSSAIEQTNTVVVSVEQASKTIQETSDQLKGTIEQFLHDVAAA